MLNKFLAITLLLLGALVSCQIGVTPCPITNHNGTVISGTIIVSANGIIPLIDGQDSQCYNYSLPYSFTRVPQVAVAVHDFESESSNGLFYFIKPLQSDSLAFVPFVIRTQWAYTRWTRIGFSFIAEDRTQDFESGYYQIDSGLLSGCASGKEIRALLPFRTSFIPGVEIIHSLFLHGFQVSTMPFSQSRRSPYELQISASSTNTSGVTVTLSVTTITQVNSIYISFIAYQTTNLNIAIGSFVYDPNNGKGFTLTPDQTIPRNYARIYGITGFIINYNRQNINFKTEWTGFQFHFHLGSSENITHHLTYEYIFFIGSQCSDCPGYPISYNGTCVSACPPNTFLTPENVCLSCGEGRFWNGTACDILCPQGQFNNPLTNNCECPPTLNWNGERCIPCTAGKIFMLETRSCECPPPLKWNGFACARLQDCQNGTVWNVYTYRCECPDYQYWNAGRRRCLDIPICKGGQVLDANNICVCPRNYYLVGQRCQFKICSGGRVIVNEVCVCPAGKRWNETQCLECINGQIWQESSKSCVCPNGYSWNGQFCDQTFNCSGNRVWNKTIEQCICPSTQYWNGRQCTIRPTCSGGRIWNTQTFKCHCRTGWKWNTTACVRCTSGQVWDQPSLQCLCPRGTVWNGTNCRVVQQCRNGQVWNPYIWQCECPDNTKDNGVYCITNPCQNGRVWSDQYKSCVCPNNKIWDSRACVPPRIDCTNGRVWDPTIYACSCPFGTFSNINKCDPIPTCNNGQRYNPLNNKCQCPFSLIFQNQRCVEPNCEDNQYWDGNRCVLINCPPGTYFKDNQCTQTPDDHCGQSEYWNGESCRYHQLFCPFGTVWMNEQCNPIGNCQSGYYQNRQGACEAIPQQCTPPTYWNNNRCQTNTGNCPSNTYYSDNTCKSSIPCQNGHVWDPIYLRCACPPGEQSNGHRCIQCTGQKEWIPGIGCRCKTGQFDLGSSCEVMSQTNCGGVPNAQWVNGLCQCNSGYTKIGLQCICYGIEIGSVCDRCSQKPNSFWDQYFCRCSTGFTEIDGHCVSDGSVIGTDDPSTCAVGSYFDTNHRKCIACPSGCLSCIDCYTCTQCRPEFHFYGGLCLERCGDGFKFEDQCDDGNNEDGDGCSRDCKLEAGYVCRGGSPDSADNCITFTGSAVGLSLTGQIRMPTSIILNIKLDYLPKKLVSSSDCENQCQNVLVGKIISGDMGATSITSQYLPGTTYSFTVKVQFSRPYIGEFGIEISIDKAIGLKHFTPVSATTILKIDVKPSYLATVRDIDEL